MWDLEFSSASQLGNVEPSFKEFLAFPAMMRLGLVSIKPDVGRAKSFPACYFIKSYTTLIFKTYLVLFYRVVSLMC
jgi:hypothetical protein